MKRSREASRLKFSLLSLVYEAIYYLPHLSCLFLEQSPPTWLRLRCPSFELSLHPVSVSFRELTLFYMLFTRLSSSRLEMSYSSFHVLEECLIHSLLVLNFNLLKKKKKKSCFLFPVFAQISV